MTKLNLSLTLMSEYWDTPPSVKVMLNYQTVIFEGEVTSPQLVEWKGELDPTVPHVLSVFRYGKLRHHTVVEDEKIVKDQLLHIGKIYFDDIDITPVDQKLGHYLTDRGEDIQNMKTLAWNGEWFMSFRVPAYLWLLESMNIS